jgi:hypothetical protein
VCDFRFHRFSRNTSANQRPRESRRQPTEHARGVERNALAATSRMPPAGNCGRKRLRVIHYFCGYPCGLTRDCHGRRAYSWIVNILCSECRMLQGRATGRTASFQPRVIAHSRCADMTSGPFLISCFDLSRRTCHFTRGIGFVPRSANLLRVIPPLSKSVQAQVRRTKSLLVTAIFSWLALPTP